MVDKPFSFKARIKSFRYALEGLRQLVAEEHNARIHLVAASVAVALGILLRISSWEWCTVAICIGVVIMAEAMNSAVEALSDLVSPEYHPLVKKAKDIAAGGVLLAACASVAVGLLIFLPKLINLL